MLRRGAGETGSGVRGAVAERGAQRGAQREGRAGRCSAPESPWAGRRSAPPAARKARRGPGQGLAGSARKISGQLVYWPEGGQTNASHQARVARLADFQKAHPRPRWRWWRPRTWRPSWSPPSPRGRPPDVSIFDRFTIFGASQRGIMRDLQPLAKVAGVKGEDQQPWCWDEVFREGKLWGLPYSTDTRMVYVNAAHLKQAGIPLTAPKTLDEFDQAMRRLTVGRPGSLERVGFIPWANNWRLFGWGWLHGGDWYDAKANRVTMDDPKNIAALDWELGRARNELGATRAWRPSAAPSPRAGCRTCSRPAPSAPPSTPPPS